MPTHESTPSLPKQDRAQKAKPSPTRLTLDERLAAMIAKPDTPEKLREWLRGALAGRSITSEQVAEILAKLPPLKEE